MRSNGEREWVGRHGEQAQLQQKKTKNESSQVGCWNRTGLENNKKNARAEHHHVQHHHTHRSFALSSSVSIQQTLSVRFHNNRGRTVIVGATLRGHDIVVVGRHAGISQKLSLHAHTSRSLLEGLGQQDFHHLVGTLLAQIMSLVREALNNHRRHHNFCG